MCGIFGVFAKDKVSPNYNLQNAIRSLTHRGPDDSGIWNSGCGKVSLGHTRLSIMDPELARQPMARNGIHISVNGEFYDFEKIKTDLATFGDTFFTQGDSEILINLYQRYGVDCVTRLSGEFAFILWDDRNKQLLAARDRYGVKPLYYFHHNDTLLLGSEVKAFAGLGVPLEWDEEAIFNLSSGLFMDPTRTVFKGVYQIPPGHILTASEADFRIREYWNYSYEPKSIHDLDSTECVNEFSRLFKNSIRRRLRADTPVACYLSGGVDSSSVLAIANELCSSPIPAYTVSFENKLYDEKQTAMEMASKVGSELHVVEVNEDDLADNFADAIRHSEYIFANAHGIAKYLLSDLVRSDGIKVVLTGEGADEVLAGYPHFREDLIHFHYDGEKRARMIEELQRDNVVAQGLFIDSNRSEIPWLENNLHMTPSFLQVHISAANYAQMLLTPEFYARFSGIDSISKNISRIDKRPIISAHPVSKASYLWNKSTFPAYVLNVLSDRMEMAHSIEGRLPFLDHELVDFLGTMPVDLKIKDMDEKWILRKAMENKITSKVLKTHKHPFTAPPSTLNPDGRLFEFVNDTLRSDHAKDIPYFAFPNILKMLEGVANIPMPQRANLDAIVTMLTSVVLLKKELNVATP